MLNAVKNKSNSKKVSFKNDVRLGCKLASWVIEDFELAINSGCYIEPEINDYFPSPEASIRAGYNATTLRTAQVRIQNLVDSGMVLGFLSWFV